jgi:hypothetical protein
MDKVCESLAPTFEKFASFNELKIAQKETENYVKSIKKFNVRTKINQEYSERILKLEKSIGFLERINDKSNRMFKTPIIEEAKRIHRNSLRIDSSPETVGSVSTYNMNNDSKTPMNKKVAVELEVEPLVSSSSTNAKTPTASSSSAAKQFQEKVLRPSWIKEKPAEESGENNNITASEKKSFQEKLIRSSWIKPKEEEVKPEAIVAEATAENDNNNTTYSSNHDLALAAMGLNELVTTETVKSAEEVKKSQPAVEATPRTTEKKVISKKESWIKSKEELKKSDGPEIDAQAMKIINLRRDLQVLGALNVQPTSTKDLLARSTPTPTSSDINAGVLTTTGEDSPSRKHSAKGKSASQDNSGPLPVIDMPPSSTVVKTIATQINITKSMNASFYEKKQTLKQSSSNDFNNNSHSSSFITTGLAGSHSKSYKEETLDEIAIAELKRKEEKGWRDLIQPQFVAIEENKSSKDAKKSHRRFNSYGLHTVEENTEVDETSAENTSNADGEKPKSWREFRRTNSAYEPKFETAKKEQRALVPEPQIQLPMPPLEPTEPVFVEVAAPKLKSAYSSYVPKFQPKLDTTPVEQKQPEAPIEIPRSVPVPPPRITGSRGLASAITLRKNGGGGNSSVSSNSSSESMQAVIPSPPASPSKKVEITYNKFADIPTRQNMTYNSESQQKPSSPINHNKRQDLEMDVPMEVVVNNSNNKKPPMSPASPSSQVDIPRTISKDEGDSGSSALSAESNRPSSSKKNRPSVKGIVKRVNSLFRTKTSEKLGTESSDSAAISEKNLAKANMSFIQDKKQSFIEKKIDNHSTIVTNTPIMKADNDEFDFIEHINDDFSSVDHEHDSVDKNQAQAESATPVKGHDSAAYRKESPVSSMTGSSNEKDRLGSKRMSISGLVRKTSSMFMKLTGNSGPEPPPPRPENLPPMSSAAATMRASMKPNNKSGGIAINASSSSSFDIPAITKLNVIENEQPGAQKNTSLSFSASAVFPGDDKGVPVDTASLGTVDKMVKEQKTGDVLNDEEISLGTGLEHANKPKKFKPVKFLKKTFESMSKMA